MKEVEVGTDLVEAKKCINALVFAIDDVSVLQHVKRIMLGLVDEIERLRTPPLAALHDREAMEAARYIDNYLGDVDEITSVKFAVAASKVARALLQGHDRGSP